MASRSVRTLFIVSRGHYELYLYLRERFATDGAVAVILDRRTGVGSLDSGRVNRRQHPEIEAELASRSHAILTLPAEPSP